jgi:hypothetical protein
VTPGTYNFTVYQGNSWGRSMTVKVDGVVVNLSTHSARMSFRPRHGAPVILALTSASGGGIVLAATAPNMVVSITPAQTAAMEFAIAEYELELVSPDGLGVDMYLKGRVTLSLEVTP